MSATGPVVVKLQGVSKYYQAGTMRVRALAGVDLELNRGDFAAVMGPSGGGKTTLLNCIGALEVPDEGEIFLNRRPVSKMNDRELTALRRREIGFVFQFFNLLPTLSVWENVELPLLLNHGDDGGPSPAAENREAPDDFASRFFGDGYRQRIHNLLEYVGLHDRSHSFPAELSGGEMQRVAIARALVHRPSLILADEPTGNLDSENGTRILDLLKQVCADFHATVVMVTHNPQAASYGNRHFEIRDGRLKQRV